jgi:hypothetical protein
VRYEITELVNPDGTHPAVHVEMLSLANATVAGEAIANAGAEPEPEPTAALDKDKRSRETVIKHCVRRLENVFFGDGSPASDADIAPFVHALPFRAFNRLGAYVVNEANFCKHPVLGKPKDIAEK